MDLNNYYNAVSQADTSKSLSESAQAKVEELKAKAGERKTQVKDLVAGGLTAVGTEEATKLGKQFVKSAIKRGIKETNELVNRNLPANPLQDLRAGARNLADSAGRINPRTAQNVFNQPDEIPFSNASEIQPESDGALRQLDTSTRGRSAGDDLFQTGEEPVISTDDINSRASLDFITSQGDAEPTVKRTPSEGSDEFFDAQETPTPKAPSLPDVPKSTVGDDVAKAGEDLVKGGEDLAELPDIGEILAPVLLLAGGVATLFKKKHTDSTPSPINTVNPSTQFI
tara:strand:+ start:5597 stop:6448 length:852 start_codon:yes stop_codon:yes gene_type:complete